MARFDVPWLCMRARRRLGAAFRPFVSPGLARIFQTGARWDGMGGATHGNRGYDLLFTYFKSYTLLKYFITNILLSSYILNRS